MNFREDQYLNCKQASRYLQISESNLRRWVADDAIPYHRIGKLIRFAVHDLNEWMDEMKQGPNAASGGAK